MSSYTNLYGNLFGNIKPKYSKYKNYLHARAVMKQYCPSCNDGTDIQMPNYIYNPYASTSQFGRISYPEFLEYE